MTEEATLPLINRQYEARPLISLRPLIRLQLAIGKPARGGCAHLLIERSAKLVAISVKPHRSQRVRFILAQGDPSPFVPAFILLSAPRRSDPRDETESLNFHATGLSQSLGRRRLRLSNRSPRLRLTERA
jgi:hypothetical protein